MTTILDGQFKKPPTLEDLVNMVDYKDMFENYKPSEFAVSFINFVKLVNDGNMENLTPIMHFKLLDSIIVEGYDSVLNVVHRGGAKTSILGRYLFPYLALYKELPNLKGKIDLCMYVTDTMENGVKNMRNNLEFMWENSKFLRKYLPYAKFTDPEWVYKNSNGEETTIKGFGVTSSMRGVGKYNKRPTIAVLDDLITDKNSESPTIIKDVETTVNSAVRQALNPNTRKMLWIGTPFNRKDPLYKAASSGMWYTQVFPVCQEFPCKREEFVGSWEDRFSYDFVKREYDFLYGQGKIADFNRELMLRVVSDEDRIITVNDIIWYSRDELLKQKHKYNFYITTDFATSEKQKSDYSVISVWAYNHNSDWLWVDGKIERHTMDKNIDDLFRFVNMYNPQSVGVEVSGQQGGFISWIRKEMLRRNHFFALASDKASGEEGLRPTTNKLQRFNVAVPLFKSKKIWFPEELKDSKEMKEAMEELLSITPEGFKSKHDDFVDTVSQLPLLSAWNPPEETQTIDKKSNDEYVRHLLENGGNISSYIV
jgi:phage terminase large subunit-like protein